MSKEFNNQQDSYERHVVLVTPDVHWNAGNIGRTCLGTGAFLHLIKPLGFSLESKEIKRAGLDYWPRVKLTVWEDFASFMDNLSIQTEEIVLFSKNGDKSFRSMPNPSRLFLIFGAETRGLPGKILAAYSDAVYHIPISREIRSLNLSTCAGIALYESLRHIDSFHGWQEK